MIDREVFEAVVYGVIALIFARDAMGDMCRIRRAVDAPRAATLLIAQSVGWCAVAVALTVSAVYRQWWPDEWLGILTYTRGAITSGMVLAALAHRWWRREM